MGLAAADALFAIFGMRRVSERDGSMRLLVCGSREWAGTWEEIGVHLEPDSPDPITVIHGACSRIKQSGSVRVEVSVDMLADFAARGLGHTVEAYPVDHAIDGPWPSAGPKRNARMLAEGKPTHGLAFGALFRPSQCPECKRRAAATMAEQLNRLCPGCLVTRREKTGTGDMVARMLRAGLPVRWVATHDACAVDLTAMPGPEER